MCCDAGWTGVAVTFQRLNTAQSEHETACPIDHIGPGTIGIGHFGGGDQLARRDDADTRAQTLAGQHINHGGQRFLDRQTDIIHQRHGRGTSATIATIHGDKVGSKLLATR